MAPPMAGAFSRLPSLLPIRTNIRYHELPSHEESARSSDSSFESAVYDLVSPFASSPLTPAAWRKTTPRWRMGYCHVAPKRAMYYVIYLIIGLSVIFGGLVYRTHVAEEEKEVPGEPERIPNPWESYVPLNGFYSGVRSLVNFSDWVPEQHAGADLTVPLYASPPFEPELVDPFPDFKTEHYLSTHRPVQACFLDDDDQVPAPGIFAYPGIPANMTAPFWGSYEELGVQHDRCYDRFGRFGPYGYSYNVSEGGLGLSSGSETTGVDRMLEKFPQVDYRKVDWGKAQRKCYERNQNRFNNISSQPEMNSTLHNAKVAPIPRTAFVLRTWTGYEYTDIQVMTIRAMINELSLQSGGEYDVHLLVHVKDDTIPIWASEEIYNQTLRENVPEEFWGISSLWSEQLMRAYYPGPFRDEDNVENHSGTDIHGVYRSAHFAIQWFAQQHPEYEYYWNWEMDVRYTGHYYEFHNGAAQWAAQQPRKLLWERSSRFYIPDLHKSWDNFSRMVEEETLQGPEPPIWGPVDFATAGRGMLPHPKNTVPPTSFEDDNYEWGVGEEADLIVFDPFFDPEKTFWGFRNDITGYNTTLPKPPRRTAIVTIARLSKRLLATMHEETFLMRHTMFPEMWPPSVALHHGYKAAYAPHPVYFDRIWPLDEMDRVFNRPQEPQDSPFAGGEHNMAGGSFYYNAGFSGALWRRWLGAEENNSGGRDWEISNSGRMCLRPVLHHPIKFERVV